MCQRDRPVGEAYRLAGAPRPPLPRRRRPALAAVDQVKLPPVSSDYSKTAHAGSKLKLLTIREGTVWKPAFQPYWGKPAVRLQRC